MVKFTKDIGRKESRTGKERLEVLMALKEKEYGRMVIE